MNRTNSWQDYANYIIEDFIKDKYFQQWVLQPQKETREFWKSFIEKYPEKEKELDEAKAFLKTFQFKEQELTQKQYERMWEKIKNAINPDIADRQNKLKGYSKWWWVAAAAALIIVSSLAYLHYLQSDRHIYTDNGEFRKITMPDGSLITLSPNSEITYKHDFRKNNTRDVWLKGEAFFSVSHHNNDYQHKPFIVHTEDLNVRVLGTTFNVNTRHYTTKVVLNTGKINIQFKDKKVPGIYLSPGDMLTYSEKENKIETDSVNTLPYISWKDKKFIFDKTPVKKIAREIEDYYGYKVKLESKTLAEREITGILKVSDASTLINVLSTLLNINIEQKDDTLIFKSHY